MILYYTTKGAEYQFDYMARRVSGK